MAKPHEQRVDSLEYISGNISADHDLTGLPIYVALPKVNVAPLSAEFQAASVVSVTELDDVWTAKFRILVGPGGTITKGSGLYDWTVKLTDSPEVPVKKGGQVRITPT